MYLYELCTFWFSISTGFLKMQTARVGSLHPTGSTGRMFLAVHALWCYLSPTVAVWAEVVLASCYDVASLQLRLGHESRLTESLIAPNSNLFFKINCRPAQWRKNSPSRKIVTQKSKSVKEWLQKKSKILAWPSQSPYKPIWKPVEWRGLWTLWSIFVRKIGIKLPRRLSALRKYQLRGVHITQVIPILHILFMLRTMP